MKGYKNSCENKSRPQRLDEIKVGNFYNNYSY